MLKFSARLIILSSLFCFNPLMAQCPDPINIDIVLAHGSSSLEYNTLSISNINTCVEAAKLECIASLAEAQPLTDSQSKCDQHCGSSCVGIVTEFVANPCGDTSSLDFSNLSISVPTQTAPTAEDPASNPPAQISMFTINGNGVSVNGNFAQDPNIQEASLSCESQSNASFLCSCNQNPEVNSEVSTEQEDPLTPSGGGTFLIGAPVSVIRGGSPICPAGTMAVWAYNNLGGITFAGCYKPGAYPFPEGYNDEGMIQFMNKPF